MKLGKFSLNFHEVDLNQIVNEIACMIRIQLQLRPQVKFELQLKDNEELEKCFITDAQRLKQIMINILRNSVKFTMSGIIRLTAEMVQEDDILFVRPIKKLRLIIYDTGLGIKEQDIQNLFKIFGKLNDPQQINKEGTGLGLYITHTLVSQLGGSIDVESKYGEFTKFTVTIASHL